jgi:hypothetical protein
MKRIFTSIALLTAFAFGASAQQRTTELETLWISPDTGVINTLPCTDSFDVEFLYINRGPNDILVTDTFFFYGPFTPEGQVNYVVPDSTVKVNDTLIHYGFKMAVAEIELLASLTDGSFLNAPFDDDDYFMFSQGQGFYNAQTPPAGYLELLDGASAGTGVKIDCATGLTDLFGNSKKQTLVTYPNPTNGKLAFKFNFNNTVASVRITDIAGRVVMTKEFGKQSGEKELSMDISTLNNGMYFLELTAGDVRAVGKVTVQK